MDFETKIRETLGEERKAPPPAFEGWTGLQRRARKARARRTLGGIAMVALLAIGAAALVPRLTAEDERSFAGDGTTDPTEFVDHLVGYSVDIPAGWEARGEEGGMVTITRKVEVPEGQAGTVDMLKFVAVVIRPEWPRVGAEVSGREHRALYGDDVRTLAGYIIAGKTAGRWVVTYARDEAGGICSGCTLTRHDIDWGRKWVVLVDLIEGDEASAADVEVARSIIGSGMQSIDPKPSAVPHGTFAADVPLDAHARVVQSFLEARVNGLGAERFMTDEVQAHYADSGDLYRLRDRRFTMWRVFSVTDDGPGTTFSVGITTLPEGEGGYEIEERLTVDVSATGDPTSGSSGTGDLVIVASQRVADDGG